MKNNIILLSIIFAMVMLTVSCGPRLRNNPFDPGSAYNSNVNALYISAVSNIVQLDASSVTIKWDRNVQQDFYTYRIYGGTSSAVNTNTPLASIENAAVNTYTATGLIPFTEYYFRVAVENKSGFKSMTPVISFRTPPATGGIFTVRDPSFDLGLSKIYSINAINGYLFLGYYGSPSRWGGLGAGKYQNMVRMFWLPSTTLYGYDIDECDNLALQFINTNTADGNIGGNTAYYFNYDKTGDTNYSSLENGIGDTFFANGHVYYSDKSLGDLYVLETPAYIFESTYWTRKTNYWTSSVTTNATNYWWPSEVFGGSANVNTGVFIYGANGQKPTKYKVEYGAVYDTIYVSTAQGKIFSLAYNASNDYTPTEEFFDNTIEYGDLVSFAADATNLYIIEKTQCRFRIYNKNTHQLVAMVGKPGSSYGEFNGPSDIDVYKNNVFVADTENNRVQVFTTAGQFVSSIGTYGDAPTQFKGPTCVVVSSNQVSAGNWDVYLLVADKSRIRYFNIDAMFQ
ncbi:MAG: fibronectin type III domain-containing protein [Spirochaetes bacterium]|nr:fibronectin type III domain-containing protein [Spirochaetota bacterium]